MSESTDRPMTAEEARAHFADIERREGAKVALMEEAKMDIETIVEMVNFLGSKAIRRNKAREFAKAFDLPDRLLGAIEILFYGDLEARLEAGRQLWKHCDRTIKEARSE